MRTNGDQPTYVDYEWVSGCGRARPGTGGGATLDCGQARSCPTLSERLWRLWGKRPNGDWDPLGSRCLGHEPKAPTPKPKTVTPGIVLNAIERIGLPELTARTQPEDKTLVNFATIFYTRPQSFTPTVTLLGQQVEIEAKPVRFTWHHGDGTASTTQTPGAAYPSKEITYRYSDAHVTVHPSVEVTYTARFRVTGGDWQQIPGTVSTTGPATALRVAEATPVLSGDYR